MHRGRMTIGRLVLAIMFFGVIFAGLRSGSNDWFKVIYTLTFGPGLLRDLRKTSTTFARRWRLRV